MSDDRLMEIVRSSGSAAQNHEAEDLRASEVDRLANDLAGDWRERAERAEADVTMWKTRLVEETARLRESLRAARSPQGEDHEAGIEAAYMRGYRAHAAGLTADPSEAVRDLSRCPSPERCPRCGRTREDIRDGEGCGDYKRCPGVLSSPERNTEKLVEALLIVAASNDADLLGDPEDERTWQALDALYKRGLIATRRDWSDEYTTTITDQGREFVREALAEYSSTTKENAERRP